MQRNRTSQRVLSYNPTQVFCSWCRRQECEPGEPWRPCTVERYDAQLMTSSHGICPSCLASVKRKVIRV
jgi:hypothetical protein